MAYEVERQLLRDAWLLVKGGKTITQEKIAERSRTLARQLELTDGVSTPYLSQILGDVPKKNPRGDKLKLTAMAFESVVNDHADSIPNEALPQVQSILEHVLTEFRLQPITWSTPGAPLDPQALNLIRRSREEDQAMRVLQDGGNIFVGGGPGMGKSTMANRILARCEERGWRGVALTLDTETAESKEIGRVYEAVGHAIGVAKPPSDRFELETALASWLQQSPLPAALVLDGFNLLYGMAEVGSTLTRAILRGWTQKAKTGTANNPWRRLRLVVVYAYPPVAHGAALTSVAPAGFTPINCRPFDAAEALSLVSAHCRRFGTNVPDGAAERLSAAALEWFGGHPLLVHDVIDRWARDPGQGGSIDEFVRKQSDVQDQHVQNVAAMLRSIHSDSNIVRLSTHEEDRDPLVIGINGQALINLGVAAYIGEGGGVTAEFEWSSPFYGERLRPLLART